MAKKKSVLPNSNIDFDACLDEIEIKTDNQSVTLTAGKRVEDAISSGSLEYDLITGGGFPPGRIVLLVGKEKSGKSTFVYNAMANAEYKGIKTFMGDAEGSTDPNYLGNIMKQYGLTLADLFGIKDEEGNYIQRPTLRHYQPELGEPWFRLIKRTLKLLPNRIKRRIGNDVIWYDVWLDKEVKRNNGRIQTLWFLDSLPSLLPEDQDENDESSGMAAQARMYSEEFRGLPGRFAKKRSTMVCVNQVREKPAVMFGCFYYTSLVLLADGTTMHIGKIVNQKLQLSVMTRNTITGEYEPKKIINWYNNGKATKNEFITLVVRTQKMSRYECIDCTRNHLLLDYKTKTMKPAETYKTGDFLTSFDNSIKFNKDQWQVIYGSVLGDGSLRNNGNKVQLRFCQGRKQKFYLYWKYKMFKFLVSYIQDKKTKCYFDTNYFSNNKINKIIKTLYKNKITKKCNNLVKRVINNLDIKGLAIWYQDDGSFYDATKRIKGTVGWNWECSISASRFTTEDRKILIDKILKITGITFHQTKTGRISLTNRKDIKKFHRLICPYMLYGFEYKVYSIKELMDYFSSYNWNFKQKNSVIKDSPAEIIEIKKKKQLYKRTGKYDLKIEGNHNYIVSNCVVHNSPEYTPCGNAPKHYASQRIKFQLVSFGNVTIPTKELVSILEEESWDGRGVDGYQLTKLTVEKNKLFSPYQTGFVRLWHASADGIGYGIDPVFDTAIYLSDTGQMKKKNGGRFHIDSDDLKMHKTFTWKEFKAFILDPKSKGKKFRKKCFAQIRNGKAFDMYFEEIVKRNTKKKNRKKEIVDEEDD